MLVCGQAIINIAAVMGLALPLDRRSPLPSSPTAARVSSSCSPRSESSLTLLNVATSRQLRCVIAAGGTAGHVLPAIAVAEALSERGVFVSFAGSPDRVEARLVPDAGYAFDPFRISGFPRQPSPALLGALGRAAAAPRVCCFDLRRRRPDVVLGAGGYVAGPMVLAAASMRLPAALAEADAALGLANRLALPFARARVPRLPAGGPQRLPLPGRRAADPGKGASDPERRGARDLRAAPGPSRPARRGRARRSALAQRARDRGLRGGRPGGAPHLG